MLCLSVGSPQIIGATNVTEGGQLSLSCSNTPGFNSNWLIDGEYVTSTSSHSRYLPAVGGNQFNKTAERNDTGSYVCELLTVHGQRISSGMVPVSVFCRFNNIRGRVFRDSSLLYFRIQ